VLTQFSADAGTGALSLKSPPTVPTGPNSQGIAVRPAPRRPQAKQECRDGGWRSFPGFRNQGDCTSYLVTEGRNPPAGTASPR
jgi:hypothetical protein